MARDVRDFSKQVSVTQTLNGSTTWKNTYTNVLTRSARDDSMSTVRKNGVYCVPTDYWARFYTGNGDPFDFEALDSFKVKRGYYGDSPTDLASTLIGPNYGCSASTGLPLVPSDMRSRVIGSIRKQILQDNWNIGTDLGELPETIASIEALIRSFLGIIGALRSGNPSFVFNLVRGQLISRDGKKANALVRYMNRNKRRLAKAALKGGSSVFLAYKFAWLPILSSIHDSCVLAEKGIASPNGFKAFAKADWPLQEPPPRSGTKFLSKSWKAKGVFKMEARYSITNPSLFNLSQLGLLNPLAVAWELVPLSFVVDWFIPVGNFLSAIQKPFGLTFAGGYETAYLEWNYSAQYLPFGAEVLVRGSVMSCRANLKSFSRFTLIGLPLPTPYFRGFGSLKTDQLISLVSLAVQRL